MSGSVPLLDRPEGQRLLASLKPGDVVITPKLDRMFRSAVDALVTAEEFKAKKVSLHMLDLGGDVVSNGMSKAFFTMAAAFAELERDTIRERIRTVKTIRLHGYDTPITVKAARIETFVNPKPTGAKPTGQ